MPAITKTEWLIGADVVVVDSSSEQFGCVGAIVRISSRNGIARCSVNFDGEVFGFDQSDLQIATL